MNKKTVALNEYQYERIIKTILTGFICSDGHIVKGNQRIATALVLEANLLFGWSYCKRQSENCNGFSA